MTVIIKGKSVIHNGISYTVLSVSKEMGEYYVTMISKVDKSLVTVNLNEIE